MLFNFYAPPPPFMIPETVKENKHSTAADELLYLNVLSALYVKLLMKSTKLFLKK
jgi:hypothetical protein